MPGFQQVIEHGGEAAEGVPSVSVLQRGGDQAEGALGPAVGELVRARLPLLGHAEPGLVGSGQGGQRLMHPGEVRGPAVSQGEHDAQQSGADP